MNKLLQKISNETENQTKLKIISLRGLIMIETAGSQSNVTSVRRKTLAWLFSPRDSSRTVRLSVRLSRVVVLIKQNLCGFHHKVVQKLKFQKKGSSEIWWGSTQPGEIREGGRKLLYHATSQKRYKLSQKFTEREYNVVYDISNGVIFNNFKWPPNLGFKVKALFRCEYLKNGAFETKLLYRTVIGNNYTFSITLSDSYSL